MRRVYHDFDGTIRALELIGPGRRMNWRGQGEVETSIWFDPERGKNYRIPNDAWDKMAIRFVDLFEEN